jgi:hypothetical protein
MRSRGFTTKSTKDTKVWLGSGPRNLFVFFVSFGVPSFRAA